MKSSGFHDRWDPCPRQDCHVERRQLRISSHSIQDLLQRAVCRRAVRAAAKASPRRRLGAQTWLLPVGGRKGYRRQESYTCTGGGVGEKCTFKQLGHKLRMSEYRGRSWQGKEEPASSPWGLPVLRRSLDLSQWNHHAGKHPLDLQASDHSGPKLGTCSFWDKARGAGRPSKRQVKPGIGAVTGGWHSWKGKIDGVMGERGQESSLFTLHTADAKLYGLHSR